MPEVSFGPAVSTSSGAMLYLLYDRIDNDQVNAWLVNPRVKFYSKSGWSDSVNTMSSGGSAINGGQFHSGTINGGWREWGVSAKAVPLTYGSPTNVTFSVTVTNLSFYSGDASSVTRTWTIQFPLRPYLAPRSANNFSNTYVTDSRVDLAWQSNWDGSDGAQPWHNQAIDRTDTGNWSGAIQVAWLGWEPTSWNDTGVVANKRYDYRHRAVNSAGSSGYAYAAAPIYTTPAAPGKPTFTKQADGSVKITAPNNSPWATKFRIDDSANGTAWTTLTSAGSIPSLGAAIEYVQNNSPNNEVTHRYRIAVQTPDGKWSAWSTVSDILQLQAPPNAPTWKTVDSAYDATSSITSAWNHNPVDSTPQTAYEAQWRSSADNGATWSTWTTTGKVASTTSSSVWAANTFPQNRLIDIQVRTWGAHATASAWSASATFRTSARPLSGITAPTSNQVLSSKRTTVTWNYADAEGSAQAAAEIALYQETNQLGLWNQFGSSKSFAIPYDLEDGTAYQVEVRVRDGAGLWSTTSSVTFSVDYLPPPEPIVTPEWNPENGSVLLNISNPPPRNNLIGNPTFEVDLAGWSAAGGPALSRYSSSWSGSMLMQQNPNGTSQSLLSAVTSALPIPASATHLTLGAHAWHSSQIAGARLRLTFTVAGSPVNITSDWVDAGLGTTGMAGRRLTISAPIPAGATAVVADLQAGNAGVLAGTSYGWWDAVTLEAGTTDGSWFVDNAPPAVSNDIYRDGVLIATGVPTNAAFIDPLPLPEGSTYWVDAVSALPSSARASVASGSDPEVARRFWLNAGVGWLTTASFYGNVSRTRSVGVERDVEHFAGRPLPVETIGEAETNEMSFSTLVIQAVDHPDEFHALVKAKTTVCLRVGKERYFVSLPNTSESTTQNITASMSFSVKQVDYTEKVRVGG